MKLKKHTRNIDFKNLAIGFLLGICLLLAVGSADKSNTTGRYQCCAAGDDSLAVFVIDTQTGQTWRMARTDSYNFGTPQMRKSERQSITPIAK